MTFFIYEDEKNPEFRHLKSLKYINKNYLPIYGFS